MASVAYVELDAHGDIQFGLKESATLDSLLVLARSARVVADQIEAEAIVQLIESTAPGAVGSPAY